MDAATSDAHTTIYDDFAMAGAWPGDKWYRHLPIPGLWDPAAVVTCGGGSDGTLALEARRFTLTRRDGHDNVKALIYSTAEFGPGERGIFSVAAAMRVNTFGTERNPYGVDPGVAVRDAVGAPPGEREPIVKIDSMKIGGGLFTMYGDLCNDRQRTGDRPGIPGLDPRYQRTLFGQGASVEFKPFRIASW
jgi:hypothetical protein